MFRGEILAQDEDVSLTQGLQIADHVIGWHQNQYSVWLFFAD